MRERRGLGRVPLPFLTHVPPRDLAQPVVHQREQRLEGRLIAGAPRQPRTFTETQRASMRRCVTEGVVKRPMSSARGTCPGADDERPQLAFDRLGSGATERLSGRDPGESDDPTVRKSVYRYHTRANRTSDEPFQAQFLLKQRPLST